MVGPKSAVPAARLRGAPRRSSGRRRRARSSESATPRGGFSSETVCTTRPETGSIAGQRAVAAVRDPDASAPAAIPVGPPPDLDRAGHGLDARVDLRDGRRRRGSRPRRRRSRSPTPPARPRRRSARRPRPDVGSSATTLAVAGETTQTRPKPTATRDAPTSAGNVPVTRPGPGAIRETVPSTEFVTQTAPSPNATPVGPFPTVMLCTSRFVAGSMRETVASRPFATQTAPPPTATPAGPPPTSIVCRTSFVDGIDARDRVVGRVRDPHGVGSGGDAAGRLADRDLRDDVSVRVDDADGVAGDGGARLRPAALRREQPDGDADRSRRGRRDDEPSAPRPPPPRCQLLGRRLGELALAALERRCGRRLQRRELLAAGRARRAGRCARLVACPSADARRDRGPVGRPEIVLDAGRGSSGDEHLPAVPGGADARAAVDAEADVAAAAQRRLARVDSHAHPNRVPSGHACAGEPALAAIAADDRIARSRKGDEERVALGVDLVAAVSANASRRSRW